MNNEGNYKQAEKTTLRMEENLRTNLQNIQVAHAAQYQKIKRSNQKVGQRTKQTFLQRRHTDC